LRYLVFGLSKSGGRNNFGRICSYKRGGGKSRKYRIIDFKRNLLNIVGIVCRIEYDPNRSSYIALVCYKNGILSYIISIEGLVVGARITNYSSLMFDSLLLTNASLIYSVGNSLLLKDVPAGTLISNIERLPGIGASVCCAAGTFGFVLNKYIINNKDYILIRLPSGFECLYNANIRVVLGAVSNIAYRLRIYRKAGVLRCLGVRPTVRGVAMNPVDHPHGGGEGKKSPRVCAMSP